MLPADQGFYAHDAPRLDADLRLIMNNELFIEFRMAQCIFYRQLFHRAFGQLRRKELVASSTHAFGPVHRRIRAL
jgi:hypothetical protein